MIKLITQIKRWIDEDAKSLYPKLQVRDARELENGYYYGFCAQDFSFCLILSDLKFNPKATWLFYREFSDDEESFWQGKYEFKLIDADNYTKSIIQIDNVDNSLPVKTIMSREVPSKRIFSNDLKWILKMGLKGDIYE